MSYQSTDIRRVQCVGTQCEDERCKDWFEFFERWSQDSVSVFAEWKCSCFQSWSTSPQQDTDAKSVGNSVCTHVAFYGLDRKSHRPIHYQNNILIDIIESHLICKKYELSEWVEFNAHSTQYRSFRRRTERNMSFDVKIDLICLGVCAGTHNKFRDNIVGCRLG